MHREVFDGAEIRHGFHHHERDASGDARPDHGKRDLEYSAADACPERLGDFEVVSGEFLEAGSGEHVDVRIKRGRQDENCSAQRADFREEIVACVVPAEQGAKAGLERTGVFEEVDQRVCADVGGYR